MGKTIAIIGSRRRKNEDDYNMLVNKFFEVYEHGDEIVSGGCPNGGDRFAEIIAKKYQIPIKIYYAEWDRLGKGAGFARNTNIAQDADIILALVASDRTGGTEDTLKKAQKMINQGLNKEIILLVQNNVQSSPVLNNDNDIDDILNEI